MTALPFKTIRRVFGLSDSQTSHLLRACRTGLPCEMRRQTGEALEKRGLVEKVGNHYGRHIFRATALATRLGGGVMDCAACSGPLAAPTVLPGDVVVCGSCATEKPPWWAPTEDVPEAARLVADDEVVYDAVRSVLDDASGLDWRDQLQLATEVTLAVRKARARNGER